MVTCGCHADSFGARARTRIVVQTAATVADAYGGRSETWGSDLTLWAIVEPMAGRETYVSAQLQSRCDARITIRYQSGLSDTTQGAKRRVALGSRLYNIVAVKNLHRDMKGEGRDFQQLLCVEGEPS